MSISDAYESRDAMGLAELVADGEVTPTELLDEAIARVEKYNPSVNAVVHPIYELARAAIADGLPDGPFQGVPFLLKDLGNAAMKGVEVCSGSRQLEGYVSDHDTELVTRYKRAGLNIFGRSTSPEYGLTTTTESLVHGDTRNPWNLGHTSGGSSGGASAAVAAGILPAASASDGGGSIRVPASCTGLFGMKPSRGRMPFGPDVGEGWGGMSTVHVVSRSVRDSAALLDATHGPDLGAPYQSAPPARPYIEEVGEAPGRLRIALQLQSFTGVEVHPDCIAAVEDAAKLLGELGHEVEDAPLTIDMEKHGPANLAIIAANIQAGCLARAEALGRTFAAEDVEKGTWNMADLGAGITGAVYSDAVRTIHRTTRHVAHFMEDYDVLLSPTMATPPLEIGRLSLSREDQGARVQDAARTVAFTSLFNATGSPAMSVPLSWNAAGLPIGIQFAGRANDEATLFRLASQLEQARPWFDRRPPAV